MGEGGPSYDVTTVPLMSKLQQNFLDKYIRGVMGQMEGFQLGAPFPGYTEEAYTPKEFKLPGPFSGYRPGDDEDHKDKDDNDDEIIDIEDVDNGDGKKGKVFKKIDKIKDALEFSRRKDAEMRRMLGLDLPRKELPSVSSYYPQLLTTPFTDPYRYGMTGNYPRRNFMR